MENYSQHYKSALFLECLRHFHSATDNNWEEEPTIPDQSRLQLRTHLITEEAREFEEAAKARNLVGMADALIDLLYVTFGSIGELGLSNIAADIFLEVHRSNMSKLCKSVKEAEETIEWYKEKKGPDRCEAAYRPFRGLFIVFRKSDGKTLKSKNYSPADIEGIIETHLNKGDDKDWADKIDLDQIEP